MKNTWFHTAASFLGAHFDRIVLLAVCIWSLSIAFTFPRGKNFSRIWSDSEGYYAYLPAVFLYGSFENLPLRTPNQFPIMPETRRVNLKTTCGVAMLELPFFAAAHLIASKGWFRTKEPTGFSMVYSDALVYSAIFYVLLALGMLSKLLRRQYSPITAGWVIAILFWGTNLFYYVVGIPGTSHAYCFFLNTSILHLSLAVRERPTWGRMLLLGGMLGIAIVARPTNALMVLFPLGVVLGGEQSLQGALRWLKQHLPKIGGAMLVGAATLVPQLVYWKHISGSWIFYSYGEEGFEHWKSPYLFSVFFSSNDGLIPYSPLISLGLVGLLLTAWKRIGFGRLSLLIFALAWYAISSWWIWWFGGSFGHRAFIDWYPILALGMGYVVHAALRWPAVFKVLALCVVLAGMLLSVRLGYAYEGYWSDPSWSWSQYLHQVRLAFSPLFR